MKMWLQVVAGALARPWILPVAGCVGVLLIAVVSASHNQDALDDMQQQSRAYTHATHLLHAVGRVQDALGYGGMIHNFKNYVLRQDPEYAARAVAAFAEARAAVALLRTELATDPEVRALGDLARTLDDYEAMLARAQEDVARGLSADAIDRHVRVDDSAAFAARTHLRAFASQRFRSAEGSAARAQEAGYRSVALTTMIEVASVFTLFVVVMVGVRETRRLGRQKNELQALLDCSIDGIFQCDPQGVIRAANRSGASLMGSTPSELLGRRVADLVSGESADSGTLLDMLGRIAEAPTGRADRRFAGVGHRRDGTRFPTEVVVDLRAVDRPRRFTLVVRDLTEQRRADQNLKLVSKFEMLNQVSAGIVHDMNNVLAVVISTLELFEPGDVLDGESLDAMSHSAHRGADLMKRLLLASKSAPQRPVVLDVNAVIDGMQAVLERAVSPGSTMNFALGADLPPVEVDRHDLEDAILNLCLNGAQAMPDGGRLTIETQVSPAHPAGAEAPAGPRMSTVIRVTDTGRGMSEETRKRLFEPFFTTRSEGTGLGMSMVHRFVEAAGGEIGVRSRLGAGTTISIALPSVRAPLDKVTPRAAPQPIDRAHILLVDDSVSLTRCLSAQLSVMGHHVEVANDAAHAVQVLEQVPDLDLLLTDIVLGDGMTGFDVIRAALLASPTIRVATMTGYGGRVRDDLQSVEFDASPLIKPFDNNALRATISDALGQRGRV